MRQADGEPTKTCWQSHGDFIVDDTEEKLCVLVSRLLGDRNRFNRRRAGETSRSAAVLESGEQAQYACFDIAVKIGAIALVYFGNRFRDPRTCYRGHGLVHLLFERRGVRALIFFECEIIREQL